MLYEGFLKKQGSERPRDRFRKKSVADFFLAACPLYGNRQLFIDTIRQN
jgi:hypothetical protein